MKIETICIQKSKDVDKTFNSVITPIYATANFRYEGPGRVPGGYHYGRLANPTRTALEETIAALEGGTRAWATSSGMAAETTVMSLFEPGSHTIAGDEIYGGTYRLFTTILAKKGMEFSFVDMKDSGNILSALKKNTRAIWIETPSNPLLGLTDIGKVTRIAAPRGIITIADNTFLTPYFQKPFESGVDIVVHSTTKYLNGHSDVIGGAIVVRNAGALADEIGRHAAIMGTACSPFDAWLVLRGIKTLPVRMEAHAGNALCVAEFLRKHSSVRKVHYPGLESHPQHALAKAQMKGFGGMLSFEMEGSGADVTGFFKRLRIFTVAESLGGVESLAGHPASMSHASMPAEARKKAGIGDNLIRLSVGIENKDDLLEDLASALK